MSNLVFPDLPGLKVIGRTRIDSTQVYETASGKRQALGRWAAPRWRFQLGFGSAFLRSASAYQELQALESFAARHRGRLDSFLWQDPEDYAVTDHGFGVGDGSTTAFQLQRTRGGPVWDMLGGPWPAPTTAPVNYAINSENVSAWAYGRVTFDEAAAVAPDGHLDAEKVKETAATDTHVVYQVPTTCMAGSRYTASIFARSAERTRVRVCCASTAFGPDTGAIFDLSAGTVPQVDAGITARIYDCPAPGWYRCAVSMAAVASAQGGISAWIVGPGDATIYAGTAGSGLYLWGGQFQREVEATAYRATSSAASFPVYWPAIGDGFEPVTEPAPGVVIYKDGTPQATTIGAGGVVTFGAAPASGAVLSWSGSYFKRVCFADDAVSAERLASQVYRSGSLELETVG